MAERKLFYGVNELKGIALECVRCSGRVHLPLEKLQSLPSMCPVCSTEWILIGPSSRMSHESPYVSFTFALARLLDAIAQGTGTSFRILLEFPEPEVKPTLGDVTSAQN